MDGSDKNIQSYPEILQNCAPLKQTANKITTLIFAVCNKWQFMLLILTCVPAFRQQLSLSFMSHCLEKQLPSVKVNNCDVN